MKPKMYADLVKQIKLIYPHFLLYTAPKSSFTTVYAFASSPYLITEGL
ncbi:MAG: hypothetical protein ABI844_03060 [Saprospiraceae bacterium]